MLKFLTVNYIEILRSNHQKKERKKEIEKNTVGMLTRFFLFLTITVWKRKS